MRTLRVGATSALLIGIALIGAFGPSTASAAIPVSHLSHSMISGVQPHLADDLPAPAYDIEAYDNYCTGGGSACAPAGHGPVDCLEAIVSCPGYHLAETEIYGPDTGATFGTPYEVYAECDSSTPAGVATAYLDVDSPAGVAAYGSGGLFGGADPGVISGKATLLDWAQFNPTSDPNYPEGNPAQVSSAAVSIYDPVTGEIATISGVQNTNNITDSPNSGGLRITLSGTIHLQPYGGSPTTYPGTISCTAGGSHAGDLYYGTGSTENPPYAEGEMETNLTSDTSSGG